MHDAEVRAALRMRLVSECSEGDGTRIVEELDLCQTSARIDFAVVNGRMIGWEIKSGADRLGRLPRQQAVYSRIFDQLWLVTEDRHLDGAQTLVPLWWGLMRATSTDAGCRLEVVRRSRVNPCVDLPSLVQLLWRNEVMQELEGLGLASGLARAPRRVLWSALASAVPSIVTASELKARVRARLKTREGWRSDEPRT